MAVELKNSPGQPGYVRLTFDRRIDVDPLRLAFCNRISRTYLGRSIGKANWSPVRSHFFDAVLVARGERETTFCVGPEVSSFIPDETTIELTSEDDAIREVAVWSGVLLDFHWTAPVELNNETNARDEARIRRDHDTAQQRRREIEAEKQSQIAEEERRRKEAQAVEEDNARRQAMLARQQQVAENERKRIAAERAEADKKRQAEAEKLKEAEEKRAAEAAEAESARRQAESEKLRNESAGQSWRAPSDPVRERGDEERGARQAGQQEDSSRNGIDLAPEMAARGDDAAPAAVEEPIPASVSQGWSTTRGNLVGLGLLLATLVGSVWFSVTRDYEPSPQAAQPAQPAKEVRREEPRLRPEHVEVVLMFDGPVPVNLHVKCGNSVLMIERSTTYNACGGYSQNVNMSVRQELLFYHMPPGEYQVTVVAADKVTKNSRSSFDKTTNFTATLTLDGNVQTRTGYVENVRGDTRELFTFIVSSR